MDWNKLRAQILELRRGVDKLEEMVPSFYEEDVCLDDLLVVPDQMEELEKEWSRLNLKNSEPEFQKEVIAALERMLCV
jgi:hypothetical protein